jgi:HAD superfamily hydrolase (TIGR01450 family)
MTRPPLPRVPDRLYAAYLFDLDGTIYLGDELLPGARELIGALRERGLPVRFLSNNPTSDPEQYAAKLTRLGLPTPATEIVNTVVTMTRWLLEHAPGAVVYPIAEAPLHRALQAAGIRTSSDPAEIDVVVASYDRAFTYEKLQTAFDAIWYHRRARLVATNPDRYCPFPGGRGEPDCAAIVAAIEACTGATCEATTGKPDPAMLHAALAGLGVEPADCVMVGDRLETDVRMALDAGAAAALVLTGATRAGDLDRLAPADLPDLVLDRIDRLLPQAPPGERPATTARLRLDPADMDAVRRALAGPDAAAGPDGSPLDRLRTVEAGPDALEALPGLLARLASAGPVGVLVTQDRRPFARDGASLKPLVAERLRQAGHRVEVLELGDAGGHMESDFAEVDQVRPHLGGGRAVVALGSGKLCDVTKHACHLHEQEHGERVPLMVVQTANSVIAFGSGMATITKDGVKRTWPSRLPDALVLDGRVLRDAPVDSALGGIGDLAVIAVSFGDWRLGAELGLSSYTPASFDVLADVRDQLFSPGPAAYAERSLEGAGTLAKLAALGGFAMTLAGQSSPMSGYEHVVSHMLDMRARPSGREVASHGCQCGVSSVVCAVAWRRLLDGLEPGRVDPDACYPDAVAVERRVRATFDPLDPSGAMATECWSSYRGKLAAWRGARPRFEAFLAGWDGHRERLAELVQPPEAVVQSLARAGHPLRYEDLGVPEDQARWAFRHGHLMRGRFSSADLLNYLGWLDGAFVDEVFAEYRRLTEAAT